MPPLGVPLMSVWRLVPQVAAGVDVGLGMAVGAGACAVPLAIVTFAVADVLAPPDVRAMTVSTWLPLDSVVGEAAVGIAVELIRRVQLGPPVVRRSGTRPCRPSRPVTLAVQLIVPVSC